MTDTKTPSPSDAEVWSLYLSLPVTGSMPQTMGELARAVLAKWGASPAVAGEPFCYVSVNKQGDITRTMKRKDKWTNIPLYTTPQATQAQAGAVPLTDEQIKEVMDLVSDWGMQSHLRGEAELDAHNPEATEDEITYAKECAEKERAAWNAIKDKLQAHGIKGGQHG